MNLKLTKIYFSVQDYLMILFGTLLYGFGFNAFILSNEIVTGGVSGICALIFFASNGLIPVSVSYFVINVALLVVALKILGLKFLIKTIFGVFSLSASLSLFEWLVERQPITKPKTGSVAAERTTYTARPAVYGYHNRSVYVWCRTRIGILGER